MAVKKISVKDILMNRIEFMLIFDAEHSNPNGNPDAANMPRCDDVTGQGLVTDVCLKRKVRNYVELAHGHEPGNEIFLKSRAIVEDRMAKALNLHGAKCGSTEEERLNNAGQILSSKFFDVRAFGQLFATTRYTGSVRGPVCFELASSYDPVDIVTHSISSQVLSNIKQAQNKKCVQTMAKKYTIPYGLYCMRGSINPFLAERTGFTEADRALLFEALAHLFDFDQSSLRGHMRVRRLIEFEHHNKLGVCHNGELFDQVRVSLKNGISAPRSYNDYNIDFDPSLCPKGIKVIEHV